MARRRVRRRRRRFVRRGRRSGLVRGRMHPPTNVASPWNRIIMTATWKPAKDAKNSSFTAKSVCDLVKSELGLTNEIDVRFLKIEVWCDPSVANSNKNFIVFSPHDFISTRSLTWIEAWGTPAQPAHLHYVWPRSISNYVLDSAGTNVIGTFLTQEGCKYIFKMHMVWRPSTPTPLTTAEISLAGWRTRYSDDACEYEEEYHVVSPTTQVIERFDSL